MSGIENFIEICPTHKVHVKRMDVGIIVAENGDQLHRYKCPIPICNFRTIKRITREEQQKASREFSEFMRSRKY